METKLRQRIIGAVVLIALAILFLPLLFKSTSNDAATTPKQTTMAAQIPPPPPKPAPAPQTIVMIQNKDLNTQAAQSTNVAPANNPIKPSAASAPAVTAAANNASLQGVSGAPANASQSAPVTADTKAADTKQLTAIDSIEDAALNPAGASNKNKTATASANKTKTAKTADETIKPLKQPLKNSETHLASNTKASSTTSAHIKSTHSTIKKHDAASHHVKAGNMASASAKQITTTDKKTAVTANKAALAGKDNKASAGTAWTVRLGSFANEANAKDLAGQLRAHGFKVYTQPVHTNMGSLTRVVIGPEVKREKADAIQQRLIKELNIKSEVVPFNPAES